MGFFFNKLMRYVVAVLFFYTAVNYYLTTKSYSISPKQFKTIAAKVVDAKNPNVKSAVSAFASSFNGIYSHLEAVNPEWHAFPLGTHSFKILPLYLSPTEYVAVIGTPFASSGRIGRHWSNNTCTVLTGSVTRQTDSPTLAENEKFAIGVNFRSGQFESHVYSFAENTYLACYGRGFVPVSGIWSTVSSINHGDPLAAGKLFLTFVQTVFDRLAVSLQQIFQHYKGKATGKNEL